jgi:hypothetical protein
MALGSAAARSRLEQAGYVTGLSQAVGTRCDGCRHASRDDVLGRKLGQHGLVCELHQALVKTHGGCRAHQRKAAR